MVIGSSGPVAGATDRVALVTGASIGAADLATTAWTCVVARGQDRRRPGWQHHGTRGDSRRARLASVGLGWRLRPDPHRRRGRRPYLHPPGRPCGPSRCTCPPTRLAGDPQRPRHHGAAHPDVPRPTHRRRSPSPLRDVHRTVLHHRRPG